MEGQVSWCATHLAGDAADIGLDLFLAQPKVPHLHMRRTGEGHCRGLVHALWVPSCKARL